MRKLSCPPHRGQQIQYYTLGPIPKPQYAYDMPLCSQLGSFQVKTSVSPETPFFPVCLPRSKAASKLSNAPTTTHLRFFSDHLV